MNWKTRLLIIAALLLPFAPAFADLNYTQGAGTVIFDFICFTTKHCSAHVNINSAGTEIGTTANPINVNLNSGNAYGNAANFLSGTSGNVSNTTQTTIIGAPGAGKLYVTGVQCFNSGTTASTITLNDGAATVLFNPAGAGVVSQFPTPLIVGTTTALKFTPGSASTNQWCNAQSYNAT